MLQKIRSILDTQTTYRVVLYSLYALTACALILSALGVLKYSSIGLLSSTLLVLMVTCFTANIAIARAYRLPINHESSVITALILFFVLAAPSSLVEWYGLVFAGIIAIASKYIVAWNGANIFNPAALGVLAVSLLGIGSGAWWTADKSLFIPMIVIGFLVLLKIRRFELFFTFLITALLVIIMRSSAETPLVGILTDSLTLYPVLFLGAIMLTEPFTMPHTRYKRLMFAVIVGVIFAINVDLGFIATSPHLALLAGNLFAFFVTTRVSTKLKLVEKKQLTPTTYSFAFKPEKPIKHTAGQYTELTIPGVKLDSRGNRRTFTIASSPRNELIEIGVKFYENGSQFKKRLQELKVGEEILSNNVAGEFTLAKESSREVIFIAGGIGITPFISMIDDLRANKDMRPVELYYFINDETELAYKDTLKSAKKHGIKLHIRTGKGNRLNNEDIDGHTHADFYLSGPPGMVNGYKSQLKARGISKIHTDLFTGY